ncbi:dihydroorotase [Runella slithyformis]|uniref:Allantoinase n=1 Tax=Runella slithyformis (strain ATCC 29530 / DSM 19594 / LMG 11500 / NCIMB 11436 / LSU 4) TaxID=761193 RepID=A0A7U3ZQC3_RUNSL|nr:dihydroorotase [Runella slithyformis]AEI51391.1 Allantoinase [Runella slithyformis DSM 19594]
MEEKTLIKNIAVVNEGQVIVSDIFIDNGIIQKIGDIQPEHYARVIDGTGKYLFPGIIDGQVHFREPGLTHKGDLYTESKAAVAGGVTSFIDMPNTFPNVLTIDILAEKYQLASQKSLANFGFFLGVNGDNLDEVINLDTAKLLGVSDDGLYFTKKGNLLADNPQTMERLFANCKSIIAIHSEKEQIVEENEQLYREKYGENVPIEFHPIIRSERACYEATQRAIEIANKYKARLHILHLTTEAETHLFRNDIPLREKNITTEVSVHHLWFSDTDYERLGNLIKWNPAIKTKKDKQGLLSALLDDRIDLVTTDHAPHTLDEKQKPYFRSMSGAPIVQHSLNIMLEFYKQGLISPEKIVEKMCHNPAVLYRIEKRGYIREGYFADLCIVDLNAAWTVGKENILSKCGWSPLEGTVFQTKVTHTFVNGNLVYDNGQFNETIKGRALTTTYES